MALARPYALALALCLALLTAGCAKPPQTAGPSTGAPPPAAPAAGEKPLASLTEPVRMYFVPSAEAGKIMANGEKLGAWLESKLGGKFQIEVAPSYAAVIEGLGSSKVDVAWMPTYAYIIAHDKFGAEVELMCVRRGQKSYRGMFVTRGDSGIQSLADIAGKTVAYTDAASTSGHIYPSAMLAAEGIKPARTIFAGSHTAALLAVYEGTADVGCAYWSPPDETGRIRDARKDLLETRPDAEEVLKTVAFTEWIPNDNLSFRKDFPAEARKLIVDAILEWVKTPEGGEVAAQLSDVTDFERAQDSDYDGVRELIRKSGQAPDEVLRALEEKAKADAAKAAEKAAAASTESAAAKKP